MALAGAAGALGLPMFAYLLLSDQTSAPSLISNYPNIWTEHYLAHRYDRVDPVIGTAARTVEPFEWGSDLRVGQRSAGCVKFFSEAAQFGIRFGFTIPVRDWTACEEWSKARVRIGPLLKGEFDAASEIYAGTDHRQAAKPDKKVRLASPSAQASPRAG